MNNEYLQDIYAELRKKNYVTTQELKNLTLNYNDIKNFINKGYLIRVSKGYYKTKITGKDFVIKDSKIKKAKEEIRKKNYDKALEIMEHYPFENSSSKAHYLMFQIYLYKEDYINAKKELLKSIELDQNKEENKDMITMMLEIIINDKEAIKKLTLNK